jgi:hypothetical protein
VACNAALKRYSTQNHVPEGQPILIGCWTYIIQHKPTKGDIAIPELKLAVVNGRSSRRNLSGATLPVASGIGLPELGRQ